ncbi:MAG: Maf family protein [Candidatus Latescibacterota bacterium]
MKKLVLASLSPRRAQLLAQIGIPFTVMGSDVSEEVDVPSEPEAHVLTLSRRKAECVAGQIEEGVVLGVDTIVVLDEGILGKPRDAEEAGGMLGRLSGRWHRVFTGMTLLEVNPARPGADLSEVRSFSDFCTTAVKMRAISEAEVAWYVGTGEPMDKAGAYGIQGKGAVFIERIDGCFYNVMGLPVSRLVQMLDGFW